MNGAETPIMLNSQARKRNETKLLLELKNRQGRPPILKRRENRPIHFWQSTLDDSNRCMYRCHFLALPSVYTLRSTRVVISESFSSLILTYIVTIALLNEVNLE